MPIDDRSGFNGHADRVNLTPIRSLANPLIKDIRSLQQRTRRYQERAFLVEGTRLVGDVLASGIEPRQLIFREDVVGTILPEIPESLHVRVRVTDAAVFASISDVPHPQGVLAVVPMLPSSLEPLRGLAAPLVMVVDGVRDPGNLGTLFRSAAGAGVDHILLTEGTVDPYNPKSVRAGMGSHFRVSFSAVDTDIIANVLSSLHIVGLADAAGDVSYDNVDWTGSRAIIVGGEAAGATQVIRDLSTVRVRIPLAHGVESLNAAVAGSLLVFEAARQRRR